MSQGWAPATNATIDDAFLGGRLQLRQFRKGHRAGTDAVLLAAAATVDAGQHFIDAGAGVGAAGLALASRSPASRGILLEVDEAVAALANYNVTANLMHDRLRVIRADLFDVDLRLSASQDTGADLILSNPPFFLRGTVRASPHARKMAAHIVQEGTSNDHGSWVKRIAAFLRPGGRLLLIHRAEALPQLLEGCGKRLGGIRLRSIHPRAGQPAIRILLGATVNSRAPLSILPPLVLHDENGRFTPEADALHRGHAMAFWPIKNRP